MENGLEIRGNAMSWIISVWLEHRVPGRSGERRHQRQKQGQVEMSLKNRDRRPEGNGKPPQYIRHENIMLILEFRENHCDLSLESGLQRGRHLVSTLVMR